MRSRGGWEIFDHPHLVREQTSAIRRNLGTLEGNCLETKSAFFRSANQAIGLQYVKNLFEMIKMFIFRGTGNQDIIKVDKDESESLQDAVHQSLEHLTSRLQAQKLPKAKCYFEDIIRVNAFLMEPMDLLEEGRMITTCWRLANSSSTTLSLSGARW